MHSHPLDDPVVPKISRVRELSQAVFDTPHGRELLHVWMVSAGLSNYQPATTEEERIRKDERQRFVLSVINSLAMTPDQIREAYLARAQAQYNAASTTKSYE